MSTTEFNNNLVKTYLALLENVSTENKLELIARLSESIKYSLREKRSIDRFYGAWQSDESAEEMIEQIKAARTSNREREDF